MRTLLALIAVLAFPLQAQEVKPKEVKKYRNVPEKYQIDLQLIPNVANASEFNSVYIGRIYGDKIIIHGRPNLVQGVLEEITEESVTITILAGADGDSNQRIFNLAFYKNDAIPLLIIGFRDPVTKETYSSGSYLIWVD